MGSRTSGEVPKERPSGAALVPAKQEAVTVENTPPTVLGRGPSGGDSPITVSGSTFSISPGAQFSLQETEVFMPDDSVHEGDK